MNNIKKLLLTTAMLTLSVKPALACEKHDKMMAESEIPVTTSDIKVKINAAASFLAGRRKQNHNSSKDERMGSKTNKIAFYNDAAVALTASKTHEEIEYGAKIILVPTAKRKGANAFNGSHIFVQSSFGKMELGAPIAASGQMMIDAGDITSGAFGGFARFAKLDTALLKQGKKIGPSFADSDDFFLSDKLLTNIGEKKYTNEPARAISYYTPKFELTDATKVQFGVTYIPDSNNTGADSISASGNKVDSYDISDKDTAVGSPEKVEIDSSVKNAFATGLTIEHSFSDSFDVKLSATGEFGKSAGNAKFINKKLLPTNDSSSAAATKKAEEEDKSYKLSNLRAFNIGAVVNTGCMSFAGSYGSLGNSLTTKEFHKTGRKTDYYSGAVAYNQGPFGASLSYFKSHKFKNKLDEVTIGTHYQLAPGFKPYAQITGYRAKGRPEYFKDDLSPKKVRGTVALIGAKLSL